MSETFNSNTINLVAGILVPAVFVGTLNQSRSPSLDLVWLGVMTGLCLMLLFSGSMRRWGGGALVALYVAFVVVRLLWG